MKKILATVAFAALAILAPLTAAQAHADPVDTQAVCTGFALGQSPSGIYQGMQHNDGRIRGPQQQFQTYWPVLSGQCDDQD